MSSSPRIINKLLSALTLIVMLFLCFVMSSCKEHSNASSHKDVIAPEISSSKSGDDRLKSTVDVMMQDGTLTNEQFQNNPPTASRPRFPAPKPTPIPAPIPAPAQGSEGGSQ